MNREKTMPPESVVVFIIASALLSIAPGPDNIFVLTQSALYGRRAGILITLGLCTGLIVHTSAVAVGVAAVFQASVAAFTMLKVFGVMYLLYLAWQAFRISGASLETSSSNLRSDAALYRRGVIMNITNPKVSIFFLAFLPQFTVAGDVSPASQVFMLGAVFICIALVIFISIAILAGKLSVWLHRRAGARVILHRVAGSVFVLLALNLAVAGIRAG